MKNHIQENLNKLARETVGDGFTPNTFFISLGSNVVMVTTDWEIAYDFWRRVESRNKDKESMLEDRKWGTICDRSPITEGSKTLVTHDDFARFMESNKLKY